MKNTLLAMMFFVPLAVFGGWENPKLVGPGHPFAGAWHANANAVGPTHGEDAAYHLCRIGRQSDTDWPWATSQLRGWGMPFYGQKYLDEGPNLWCKGISRAKDPNDGVNTGLINEWIGWLWEVTPGAYAVSWGSAFPPEDVTLVIVDRNYQVASAQLLVAPLGGAGTPLAEGVREYGVFTRTPRGYNEHAIFEFLSYYQR